jgi:hypothetical protein
VLLQNFWSVTPRIWLIRWAGGSDRRVHQRLQGTFSCVRLNSALLSIICCGRPATWPPQRVGNSRAPLASFCARDGRPWVPPERLLHALMPQAFSSSALGIEAWPSMKSFVRKTAVTCPPRAAAAADANPSATSMPRSARSPRIPPPPTPMSGLATDKDLTDEQG